MSDFMKLPREIRDMIYEFCLVVNGHIVPYEENYAREKDLDYTGDKPTVSLLAVSKAIRKESARIFYGKNIWRITSKALNLNDSSAATGIEPRTIWTVHRRLFRRIVIYANRLDLNTLDLSTLADIADTASFATLQDRMTRAHRRNFNRMLGSWDLKIGPCWDMPRLGSLTFNFDKLYCLNGCCHSKIQREFMHQFLQVWCDYQGGSNIVPSPMVDNIKDIWLVGLDSSITTTRWVNGYYGRSPPWVAGPGDCGTADYHEEEESEEYDNTEMSEDE